MVARICQNCGGSYFSYRSEQKYCSHECGCAARSERSRTGAASRFWNNVDKSGDCWEWKRRCGTTGYGHMIINGKTVMTHRFSYELHYGSIPDGLWVLHHCDNRKCIRPDHLFLGTVTDNIRDMHAKGRNNRHPNKVNIRRGETHHMAKATDEVVREVRRRYAMGGITQAQLGREFGITSAQVFFIVRHKTWRHVTEGD